MEWKNLDDGHIYSIEERPPNSKGEMTVTCPVCSHDRKKKNQRCLSINATEGVGICHHCGQKFIKAKEFLNGRRYRGVDVPTHHAKAPIKITPRPLNTDELHYWQRYGISLKILEVYEVKALDNYQVGKHQETSEPGNPIFCYHAAGDSYKIYRPNAKEGQNKFFWINGKPDKWYFGLHFCKGSQRVYIAAGEKDTLTLVGQGVEAFPLNSETVAFPEDLAKKLKAQYKEVFVLYDNDEAGIKNSLKICKEHGFKRAILPEGIKDVSDLIAARRSIDEIRYEAPPEDDFFTVKTAAQWIEAAKQTPPAPQLFGPFITKSELTILFADPSAGKSALIVQVAENLCRGLETMGLKNEADPLVVLVIDFELSMKQWERRNSDDQGNGYEFHPNFYRAEINGLAEFDDDKLEDVIFSKIENLAERLKAEVIIIDNISWLHSEADKAKFAVPLMRKLKGIVKNQGLTVIVINHTVKRDESRTITGNDMAGSKQLRALADMIFTIGKSAQNKNIRYLKMLKDNRTTGEIYGLENVLVCELVKTDHLHFMYLTEGREADYLPKLENREHSPKDDQKTAAKVLSAVGMPNTDIAKHLNVTEGTIRNWLK